MTIAQIAPNGQCPYCGALPGRHNEGCRILDALRARLSHNKDQAAERAVKAYRNRTLPHVQMDH